MTGTERSHADDGRICAFSLRECGGKLEIGIGKASTGSGIVGPNRLANWPH
jgi:hypothetical protein